MGSCVTPLLGIVTSSELPGKPFPQPDQLPAVCQSVLDAPVHVQANPKAGLGMDNIPKPIPSTSPTMIDLHQHCISHTSFVSRESVQQALHVPYPLTVTTVITERKVEMQISPEIRNGQVQRATPLTCLQLSGPSSDSSAVGGIHFTSTVFVSF